MTRQRLLNIGTTAWAVGLAVLALLWVTGATPALAGGGGGLDCGTACDVHCWDNDAECEEYYNSGSSCEVTCEDEEGNRTTTHLRGCAAD